MEWMDDWAQGRCRVGPAAGDIRRHFPVWPLPPPPPPVAASLALDTVRFPYYLSPFA
jgi:hypothetical protein